MSKPRLGWILLAHWHEAEAKALASGLEADGWRVRVVWWQDMIRVNDLHNDIPRAVVISLRRLPSHGSHLGSFLQSFRWSRTIPLIYFDGSQEVTSVVKAHVPGAHFCRFNSLGKALDHTGHWRVS